jgi:hypothetical protein
MYQKVDIQKLSPNQIAKLLRGHRIRVKQGSGMALHLSAEQAKKVHSAGKKGSGCCVQFDPYQMDMHKGGEGFLDFAKSSARALAPVAVSAGKAVAPVLIDVGSNALKDYVAGKGVASRASASRAGVSRGGAKRSAPRRGRGFGKDLFKAVAPALVDVGANALKNAVAGRGQDGGALNVAGGALYNAGYSQGEGVKKGRKGKGAIGGVIGSALGDIFLPF